MCLRNQCFCGCDNLTPTLGCAAERITYTLHDDRRGMYDRHINLSIVHILLHWYITVLGSNGLSEMMSMVYNKVNVFKMYLLLEKFECYNRLSRSLPSCRICVMYVLILGMEGLIMFVDKVFWYQQQASLRSPERAFAFQVLAIIKISCLCYMILR